MFKKTLDTFEKEFDKLIWKYEDFVGRECDQEFVDECNEVLQNVLKTFNELKEEIYNV